MNKTVLTAAIPVLLLLGQPAMAEQTPTPVNKRSVAKQETASLEEFDKQYAQVQENMAKMQEQMNQIHQTQDPQERNKLLQEHWATMQSTMGIMHGMWGPGMMGRGRVGGPAMGGPGMMGGPMMGGPGMGQHMMGWRGAAGYYSRLTPEQMRQHQYMMDQYTGMQQMMMNQMMEHQQQMWMMPHRP